MLNGKIYVINSPTLISAAMRSKDLIFDPFILQFALAVLGASKQHVDTFAKPGVLEHISQVIHLSLTGDPVFRMNARALNDVAQLLNSIGPGSDFAVPEVFLWLRGLMSRATMVALFGARNPMTAETIDQLWDATRPGEYNFMLLIL